jgi:hypothetical protein
VHRLPRLAGAGQLILRFDGSIRVDRTWGEVAARCDAQAANVLGLNMVQELVTGTRSVDEARHTSEPNTVACNLGRDGPYAERLLFEVPQDGTEDLDGNKRCGAVLQQLAGRRKDAVTSGEKRPIVAPRADARRAGWSRTLAKGFRPASVAAVPLSTARRGVM